MAAAEAAFNALLARIAAEVEARCTNITADTNGSSCNGHGHTTDDDDGQKEGEEDVATAMARLLKADAAAAAALPPPLLKWSVHRFEGWVGGVLEGIAASEVRGCASRLVIRHIKGPCVLTWPIYSSDNRLTRSTATRAATPRATSCPSVRSRA